MAGRRRVGLFFPPSSSSSRRGILSRGTYTHREREATQWVPLLSESPESSRARAHELRASSAARTATRFLWVCACSFSHGAATAAVDDSLSQRAGKYARQVYTHVYIASSSSFFFVRSLARRPRSFSFDHCSLARGRFLCFVAVAYTAPPPRRRRRVFVSVSLCV